MIVYFPYPYPDELFYSWLGRYMIHTLKSTSAVSLQLFDYGDYEYSFDLPNRISTFTQAISHIQNICIDEVIDKHTLWPFYKFFLKENEYLSIYDNLKNSGKTHFRKFVRNEFQPPKSAKYCPACMQDDLKLWGEYYWHRAHQIPYMVLCPVHLCSLQICSQGINTGRKNQLVLPSNENCKKEVMDSNTNPLVQTITIYLDEILRGHPKNLLCPHNASDDELMKFHKTGLRYYWDCQEGQTYKKERNYPLRPVHSR
jgi:hypothetical protein